MKMAAKGRAKGDLACEQALPLKGLVTSQEKKSLQRSHSFFSIFDRSVVGRTEKRVRSLQALLLLTSYQALQRKSLLAG